MQLQCSVSQAMNAVKHRTTLSPITALINHRDVLKHRVVI